MSRHTSVIYLPLELARCNVFDAKWSPQGPHRGWWFIICKGGLAILLGVPFQNLDLFWRGSFSVGSVAYLAGHFNEFMKEVQSSDKHELKFSCM